MGFLRGRGYENIAELIFYYNCDKNITEVENNTKKIWSKQKSDIPLIRRNEIK